MSAKNYTTPLMATVLTVLVLASMIQLMGAHSSDLAQRIVVFVLYGLALVGYLVRLALIFMGAYAAYQILRATVNGENIKGMGV